MKSTITKILIVLFLAGTATINAQKKTTTSSIIKVEIKASNTDKELKEMVKLFKKEKINLKFKKIERNHKGEIIGISSSYKGSNGFKGNYSFSGPVPIKPFSFAVQFDDNDAISTINYERSDKEYIIAMQTKNNKVEKGIRFRVSQNDGYVPKPLFIVDGKEVSNYIAMDLNLKNIKSVSVLKNSSATNKYGEKGENGVVEIISKKNFTLNFDDKNLDRSTAPLFIIDGKIMQSNFDLQGLKPDAIESMSVLKGKSATDIYGEKAKNGAIIIKLKN